MKYGVALFLICILQVGCTPSSVTPEGVSSSATTALPSNPLTTKESFEVPLPKEDLSPFGRSLLVIKKQALGKEYLMQASVIPQLGQNTSSAMLSRIIKFKRDLNKVYILESTEGLVTSDELPSTLMLASLPIVFENDDILSVDFNEGMRSAFVIDEWYSSDSDSRDFDDRSRVTNYFISDSYVDLLKVHDDVLEIRQIANMSQSGPTKKPTVELRYFIEPYKVNPSFVPKLTTKMRRVGFFETHPHLKEKEGSSIVYTARWDVSKKIKFYISANTPKEYIKAVKDGVLYWNYVFGREQLEVEMAPQGATAPDPQKNIIQWVNNDESSGAYADALLNPRTGETLRAQVYLVSTFAVGGRDKAIALLRESEKTSHVEARFNASFKGHFFDETHSRCNKGIEKSALSTLAKLVAQRVPDSAFLHASQDYVASTVAHEVGHVLGLRHNFAGSVASKMTLKERDEAFLEYLKSDKVPNPVTQYLVNTTMEYPDFKDDALTGAQIRKSFEEGKPFVYPYDKAAIDWGYFDQPMVVKPELVFCSDEGLFVFQDCKKFDSGSSSLLFYAHEIRNQFDQIYINVASLYISNLTKPDPYLDIKNETMRLLPSVKAENIASLMRLLLKSFVKDKVRSLRVESKIQTHQLFAEEILLKKRWENLLSDLSPLGEEDRILFNLLRLDLLLDPNFPQQQVEKLNAYLSKPEIKSGIGSGLVQYVLLDEEIARLSDGSLSYFKKFQQLLLKEVLEVLKSSEFDEESTLPLVSNEVIRFLEKIIFSYSNEKLYTFKSETLNQTAIAIVPEYDFSFETRKAAASLFGAKINDSLLMASVGSKFSEKLDYQLHGYFDLNPSDVDKLPTHELPFYLRRFIDLENQIIKILK